MIPFTRHLKLIVACHRWACSAARRARGARQQHRRETTVEERRRRGGAFAERNLRRAEQAGQRELEGIRPQRQRDKFHRASAHRASLGDGDRRRLYRGAGGGRAER